MRQASREAERTAGYAIDDNKTHSQSTKIYKLVDQCVTAYQASNQVCVDILNDLSGRDELQAQSLAIRFR
jgi:hypothetical protein